jgi:hypothetical protein
MARIDWTALDLITVPPVYGINQVSHPQWLNYDYY